MSANVTGAGASPEPSYGPPRRSSAQTEAASARPDVVAPLEDDEYLAVEPDPATGEQLYRVVNRNSGRLVRTFTSAELRALGAASGYASGSVLKARA